MIGHIYHTVPLPRPELEGLICKRHEIDLLGSSYLPERDGFLKPLAADTGSFFQAVARLSIITQDILTFLHSAAAVTKSPEQLQQDTARLDLCLSQWSATLPPSFNYWEMSHSTGSLFARERILLGAQLSSARMLLTQPSLYAIVHDWSPDRAQRNEQTRRMSVICVEAAKTLVDLLPDEPSVDFVYGQCSWWCIVHHLTQAASILLLSSSSPISLSWNQVPVSSYLKKIVHWLHIMDDQVARQAVKVLDRVSDVFSTQSVGVYPTSKA